MTRFFSILITTCALTASLVLPTKVWAADYHCYCSSFAPSQAKLNINQQKDTATCWSNEHCPDNSCANNYGTYGLGGEVPGLCPTDDPKNNYFYCLCPDATSEKPNQKKCYQYPVTAGESLPSTCYMAAKGCEAVKPVAGSCPTQDQLSGDSSAGRAYTMDQIKTLAGTLNPGKFSTPYQLLGKGIQFSFGAMGVVTLSLYIWAGFLWMTSSGNSEKVERAKKIFLWTSLGVVALVSSYMVLTVLFSNIIK